MKKFHRKPLKVLLAASVFSLIFTSSIHAASPTIDPFAGRNIEVLQKREENVLREMNDLRQRMGMEKLVVDDALRNAAQSHSNYQYETNENSGHEQPNKMHPYYSGRTFFERANNYGYSAEKGGESLTSISISEKVSLQKMIDAPFHRIGILNPNHEHIGVGSNFDPNRRSALVLTFGSTQYENSTPIMYPYNKQTDVQISWYENERPNPLEGYGLKNVHTGYPITFHYGDKYTAQFETKNAVLKDSKGNEIDYYLVDHTAYEQFRKQVTLIPKEPLEPNTTYTVSIEGTRHVSGGGTEEVSKEWSFHTVKELELLEMGVRNNRFEPFYNAGDLKNVNLTIFKDGQTFHFYKIEDGESYAYAVNNIVDGEYRYTLSSPNFTDKEGYFKVKNNKVIEIDGVKFEEESIMEDDGEENTEEPINEDEEENTEEPINEDEEEEAEEPINEEEEAEKEEENTEETDEVVLGLKGLDINLRTNQFLPEYNLKDIKDVLLTIFKDELAFHVYDLKDGKSYYYAVKKIVDGKYHYVLQRKINDPDLIRGYFIVKNGKVVELYEEGKQIFKEEDTDREQEQQENEGDGNGKDEETEKDNKKPSKGFPSNPDRYKKIDIDKPLKNTQRIQISFSQRLADESVNKETVYVINKDGETVPIKISVSDRNLIITPSIAYETGSYTIIIENVTGTNKLPLKTPLMISFAIK